MAFVHGKNTVITVNSVDLSAFTNTSTFTRGANSVAKTLVGIGGPQPVVLTAGDLAALGDGIVTVSATQTDRAGNPQTAPATAVTIRTTSSAGTAP